MSPLINAMNFEELLQCPVCFELPSGAILQCEQGHAVCQTCCRKLTNCPVCRGVFYGTRNYVMEELIDKIKRVNIKNNKETNKISKVPKIIRRTPPPASTGIYPCKVPQCDEKLPACRMLRHVRNCHKEILHESSTQDGLAFTRVMDILWIPNMRQVFAMQISDMGLFYLVIDNDSNGTLRAWLQMVAHHNVSQTFLYELNFHSANSQTKTVFIDKVQSVRQPDTRFLSPTAVPMCTFIDKRMNIFNLKRDCPISRLHLAITFCNTFQPTIVPSGATKIYRNCQNTHYPELNRQWRFELSDKNNMLQGAVEDPITPITSTRNINPIVTRPVISGNFSTRTDNETRNRRRRNRNPRH